MLYLRGMRNIFTILLLLLLCQNVFSQTEKINNCRRTVYNATPKEQYAALFQLFEYRYSMPVDSLVNYLRLARKLGGDTISRETGFTFEFIRLIGDGRNTPPDSLISRTDSLLRLIPADNHVTNYDLVFLHYKGGALVRTGKYKEGLAEYYKLLRLAEKRENVEYVCAAWNGIGWVHMETEKYKEAINYFRKVMNLVNDTAFSGRPNVIYSNLASCYCTIGENDSALKYILRVEKNVRAIESLQLLANALAIKSDVMKAMGKKDEVAACLTEMVDIRRKIGDVLYVISDMFLLAQYYGENGECQKGIAVCKEALALIEKYHLHVKELIIREALAKNYSVCGNYELYAMELRNIMALKDSMNKTVSAEVLAEMEAKYNLEKKQEQIEKQELMISKRNYLVYGSMALFTMVLLMGFQYIRIYKQRSAVRAERAITEAKEVERNRIAAELHDNIGTQLGFISRKIDIARTKGEHSSDSVLDEINIASRRTIADLRETIWTLKKERVDFRELADRLKVYARKQFEDIPQSRLEISEHIRTSAILSAVDSLNVFRISQEAIYNATIHSMAKNVWLEFRTDDNGHWKVMVKDDGIGFDKTKDYQDHYGLENMRQRAVESALVLSVDSRSGEGTLIVLQSSGSI
jgi:two-component system, NarL family, sensor kinase